MPNPELILPSHSGRTPARKLFIAACALALAVFAFSALSSAPTAGAAIKRIELGASTKKVTPNCGSNFARDCTAEGKVTGYQVLAKGADARTFVVPFKGKVVAWSIQLAKPTRKDITENGDTHSAQLPFFNDLFGSPASARIAVLKRVQKRKKGPPRYEMVRQGPTEILNPYFGSTVHFALSKPLNVIPKQVVGLTIPTWAPAYWKPQACNVISLQGDLLDPNGCERAGKYNSWRGSRAPDKCTLGRTGEFLDNLEKSRPQQKLNSVKRYGCYYTAGRLLYTATVVAKG